MFQKHFKTACVRDHFDLSIYALLRPGRPVLDLHTPKGWKAELTWMLVIYRPAYKKNFV